MSSVCDPIADMLVRIKNGQLARLKFVDMPFSKMKYQIAKILMDKGFIAEAQSLKAADKPTLRLTLKYSSKREPIITEATRISKPGLRKYVSFKKIPKVLTGLGIAVVSTPNGVLEGEEARQRRVGGELLCKVW